MLGEYLAEATAAGVTGLHGQRRLWHGPAVDTQAAEAVAARRDRSAVVISAMPPLIQPR